MRNIIITLLNFAFLTTLCLPFSVQAQQENTISFNPETGTSYNYDIQLKVTRGGHSRYVTLTNKLIFSKIDKGYQILETIDKFATLSGGQLKFNLSATFMEGSKLQKMQEFLKAITLTTKVSKKGASLALWDYSSNNAESNLLNFEEEDKERTRKILQMFSRQSQPFYAGNILTTDAEFSRRKLAPAFFQKNDSTYYRTDYKVVQKTDRRTILSYQRMPESIQKGQRKSNIQIKGMVVVENASGLLLHRRELLKGFDLMEYQLVLNRKDVQKFSLNDPSLENFTYYSMEADTLDKEAITRMFSMRELPDSFPSKAKARRYIRSLQPFLFYRKSLYGNSAQLLYKNINNEKFIRAEAEWLKGFDANDKLIFHSEFQKNELSFLVPQGTSDGIKKISGGQFIIPDTIDVLRGSLKFDVEIGAKSRELTKKDIGRKIDLTNSNLQLLSWNDSTSTVSYIGLGGLKFYDRNGEFMLPKKATSIPHFIPQITGLLDKPTQELTKDDFFLYANIDDFPHFRYHYTLQFENPVAHIKVLEADEIQPITRTFTIKKK